MAENNNIGEISFGVNADTGDLLASVKTVDSATTQMASSFQELTKKIAGTESGSSKLAAQFGGAGKAAAALENEVKRLGGQVQANGNVVDQFGVRNAKLTATLAALRGATFQTTSSFRMMRGGMQQIGYQVQDIAVQLQMGQNPLMVLAQQGSQVASIFGTGGAVFGALLAVSAAIGMALLPSLFDSKEGIDAVTEAAEKMGKAIDMKDGVAKFTDELEKIADRSRAAAESFVADEILKGNATVAESVDAIGGSFGNVTTSIENAGRVYRQYQALVEAGIEPTFVPDANGQMSDADMIFGSMQSIIGQLNKELGLTSEQSTRLLESFLAVKDSGTAESILNLESVLVSLQKETGVNNSAFGEFIGGLRDVFNATSDAADIIAKARDFLGDFDGALARNTASAIKARESYSQLISELAENAQTTGMNARELDIYNAKILLTLAGEQDRIESAIKLINQQHDQIDATNAATAADKARDQEIKRGTKSLDDQIMQLALKTETLGMDERQLAKHTAMQLINAAGLDVNTEAVMANIDSLYDAIEAKQRGIDIDKDLDNQTKAAVAAYRGYQKSLEDQSMALKSTADQREAFLENIKQQGVLAGRTGEQIQELVQGYRDLFAAQDAAKAEDNIESLEKEIQLQVLRNALTEERFELEAAILALGENASDEDKERITELITQMQAARFEAQLLGEDLNTAFREIGVSALDELSSGIANAVAEGDSLSDALSNIARTIATEVLGSIIRYFIGQAAAKIMADKTETASGLAASAIQTKAAVAMAATIAGAMTPAAIATNIATSGGAATAATASMATQIPIMAGLINASGAMGGGLSHVMDTMFGGGRLYGGRTEAGKLHPILEDGKPEMLTMGNRNYLMTPSSGMVTSNKDMMGGGSKVILNLNNYAGVPVTANSRTEGNGMTRQEIIDVFVGDMRSYGEAHKAITDTTTATGRVR